MQEGTSENSGSANKLTPKALKLLASRATPSGNKELSVVLQKVCLYSISAIEQLPQDWIFLLNFVEGRLMINGRCQVPAAQPGTIRAPRDQDAFPAVECSAFNRGETNASQVHANSSLTNDHNSAMESGGVVDHDGGD
jgi:hypothetical protein